VDAASLQRTNPTNELYQEIPVAQSTVFNIFSTQGLVPVAQNKK
jgi:hypothetical protein